jgi:hypothetical protein
MEEKRIHTTILIKRRVSGEPGPPTSLTPGELAFNEVTNTAYIGTDNETLSGSTPPTDPGFF